MQLRQSSAPLSRHTQRVQLVRSGQARRNQARRALEVVEKSSEGGNAAVPTFEQLKKEFRTAVVEDLLDPVDRDRMAADLAALGKEVADLSSSQPSGAQASSSPVFTPVGSTVKASRRRPPTPEPVTDAQAKASPSYMQETTASRTRVLHQASHSWSALVSPAVDKPVLRRQRPASASVAGRSASVGRKPQARCRASSVEIERPTALPPSFAEQAKQGRIRYRSSPPIPTQQRRRRPTSAPCSRSDSSPQASGLASCTKSKRRLQMTPTSTPVEPAPAGALRTMGVTDEGASSGAGRGALHVDTECEENAAVWAAVAAVTATASGAATPPPRSQMTPVQKEAADQRRRFRSKLVLQQQLQLEQRPRYAEQGKQGLLSEKVGNTASTDEAFASHYEAVLQHPEPRRDKGTDQQLEEQDEDLKEDAAAAHFDGSAAAGKASSAESTNDESFVDDDVGEVDSGHKSVHDLAAEQLSSTMAGINGGSGRSLGDLQRLIASVESSAQRDSTALSLLQSELNESGEGEVSNQTPNSSETTQKCEAKPLRSVAGFPFDRSKQASLPPHVEALVDVGTPGQKMPWINSLGKEAKELKERKARQGHAELQQAYRQRAAQEAEAALAEQRAAELAMEMADARTAAVAEQCAQRKQQGADKKAASEVTSKNYGVLHDSNPAAPAPGSAAAAVAADRKQHSSLEQQAKEQLHKVLRRTHQQQAQHAHAIQTKKKTRLSKSQSAVDEVRHIARQLCDGRHELGGNSHRRRGVTATGSALSDIGMHDSHVNGRKVKAKGQAKRTKSKGKNDVPSKQETSKAAKTGIGSPTPASLHQNKKSTRNKSKQKERENEARAIAAAAAERWLPLDDKHDRYTF